MELLGITPFLFLIMVLFIATVDDIRFYRIPNWLTYPTMIVGIAYHIGLNGYKGLLFSLEGIIVGIAFLLLFYLMGGMGAGDVKLMGAIGGLLGPEGVFRAFLFTAVIGGVYGLILLAVHGHLKETIKSYRTILKTFVLTRNFIWVPSPQKEKKPRLHYGVAIALGTLSSVFWRSILYI